MAALGIFLSSSQPGDSACSACTDCKTFSTMVFEPVCRGDESVDKRSCGAWITGLL